MSKQLPTLEEDIGAIRILDTLRGKARSLRDGGIAALSAVMAQDELVLELHKRSNVSGPDKKIGKKAIPACFPEPYRKGWGHLRIDEPAGLFAAAVADLATDKNLPLARTARRKAIERISLPNLPGTKELLAEIKQGSPTSAVANRESELALDSLFRVNLDQRVGPSRLPVFEVSRVMQDLVRHPGTVFSRASFLCYFILVRELFRFEAPSWRVGGATAIQGGIASAYMTSECVRALSAFARTLDTTAQVLQRMLRARSEARKLITFEEYLSPQWVSYEEKRILLSLIAYLHENESNIAIRVDTEAICRALVEGADSLTCRQSLEKITRDFLTTSKASAKDAERGIDAALSEVSAWIEGSGEHSKELGKVASFSQAAAGEIAKNVLETGRSAIISIREAMEEVSLTDLRPIEKVVESLAKQARSVRKLLTPSVGFLESVVDRELARSSFGLEVSWNPAELAFAAAALAALGDHAGDPRLSMAERILSEAITRDGDFPMAGVLESDFQGYALVVVRAEILRAFSQLLQFGEGPIDPTLVTKMISRFEKTKLDDFGDWIEGIGWTHDNPRFPEQRLRWTSGITILALDRLVRMLDTRINARVLRHFSVKYPPGPSLDQLVYPDFGAALDASPEELTYGKMESVAYDLLQMYCHLKGEVPLPKRPTERRVEHSAVLYGPPGTGKTTLAEALASSSGLPLVVVTPSDIVVYGEAGLERRARDVFVALQALSSVVIMFDEFEPVLRSRTLTGGEQRSLFQFLTPGMLPKLKDLHVAASKSQVALFLVTNRLGELDGAAIRAGRFDRHIGVYPPNPTARSGQLIRAFIAQDLKLLETMSGSDHAAKERFLEIILKTAYGSIGRLATKGIFLPSSPDNTGLNCLAHVASGSLGSFSPPDIDMEPEYLWREDQGRGAENFSEEEVEEWSILHAWELALEEVFSAWLEGSGRQQLERKRGGGTLLLEVMKKATKSYAEFSLPREGSDNLLSWIRRANRKRKGPRDFTLEVILPAYREVCRNRWKQDNQMENEPGPL